MSKEPSPGPYRCELNSVQHRMEIRDANENLMFFERLHTTEEVATMKLLAKSWEMRELLREISNYDVVQLASEDSNIIEGMQERIEKILEDR